jgi:hypothetical protein
MRAFRRQECLAFRPGFKRERGVVAEARGAPCRCSGGTEIAKLASDHASQVLRIYKGVIHAMRPDEVHETTQIYCPAECAEELTNSALRSSRTD